MRFLAIASTVLTVLVFSACIVLFMLAIWWGDDDWREKFAASGVTAAGVAVILGATSASLWPEVRS